MLFTLFFGFFLGALTIIAVEVFGVLHVIGRLKRKAVDEDAKSSSESSPGLSRDPHPSYHNKQGVVWVLALEKVPKNWQLDKISGEKKQKKEILEVFPVKKYAKIKNHTLVLSESDGSHAEIALKGCLVSAVSATNLSSRKWAKRYPIIVDSKTSIIYSGSKTIYIYFETSWEKESWCKALRLASCEDNEKSKWFAELNTGFHSYMTSLNTGYPSFMKPSTGFNPEPIDRPIKLDSSTSRVRHFLKKITKKTSRAGGENKLKWNLTPSYGGRKFDDKSFSLQEALLSSDAGKASSTTKAANYSSEEDTLAPSSSISLSGSKSFTSVVSDACSDDKVDEGTLCWNLLLSRMFFDVNTNAQMKTAVQARIQRMLSNMRSPSYIGEIICTGIDLGNLPPYVHGMRVLPSDMNAVCAFEMDIEYSGGAMLDIETRLEVRELDLQEGTESTGEVSPDLLEGFEYFGEQLKLSEENVNTAVLKSEEDTKIDGSKSCRRSTLASSYASRWRSVLNSVAKQVSQVPISMAIGVASIRGTMRLHIKPPPSDQIWFGFISMPEIEFNLESFVGEHKITSGHIAMILISKFKAAIKDSLVHPNYESVCIPFMSAEKDDWVPRKVAPFIFINQATPTADPHPHPNPITLTVVPSSEFSEAVTTTLVDDDSFEVTTNTHNNIPEERENDVDDEQPKENTSLDANVSSSSGPTFKHSSLNGIQEETAPLLKEEAKDKCEQENHNNNNNNKNSNNNKPVIVDRSSSSSVPSMDRSSSSSVPSHTEQTRNMEEDDATKLKRMGSTTKAKMFGLGKRMGEKLEEKRRNIEVKGKHLVEKLRQERMRGGAPP